MSDAELTKSEVLRDIDHERLSAPAAAAIQSIGERHIWRLPQANANCDIVHPASSASGLSFWTASRISSRSQVCIMDPTDSLAALESTGGLDPGAYFPDSTPCASGDQTIWETPLAAESGITFSSGRRCSSEYYGFFEIFDRSPAGTA